VPNSQWSQLVTLHVTVWLHSASVLQDAGFLVSLVGFMVPRQLDSDQLLVVARGFLALDGTLVREAGKHGPGVANITTEHFRAHDKHRYASRPREPDVDPRVAVERFICLHETKGQLLLYFSRVDDPLGYFGLIKSAFDSLFDPRSKLLFHKFGRLLSEDSMTVSHCEKVGAAVLSKMRHHQV